MVIDSTSFVAAITTTIALPSDLSSSPRFDESSCNYKIALDIAIEI